MSKKKDSLQKYAPGSQTKSQTGKLSSYSAAQGHEDAKLDTRKYVKMLKGELLQPSRKHYGGMGYAKDSTFLHLDDPNYAEEVQALWDEHVPGFSGKSLKKRKSAADEGMLWRKCLKAKQSSKEGNPATEKLHAKSTIASNYKLNASSSSHSSKGLTKNPAKKDTRENLQAQAIAAYRALKKSKVQKK